MTDITELAQLRAELSNPAIGSKDHLRKLALSLVEALEAAKQDSANWFKAFEKAVSVGARYEERIAEQQRSLDQREFLLLSADHVQREYAEALGCAGDNESILQAIEDLKVQSNTSLELRQAALADNAHLKLELGVLEHFRTAYMEWSNKTDWMQGDKRFDVVRPLGKHRADVLKAYIDRLESRTVTIEPFRSFVTDADLAALHRFAECCDDPESGGHDLEKEQVRRLEAIGALQRSGRISYITDFGDVLISITAGIKVETDSVDSDLSHRNQPGMVVAVHIDAGDFVKVKGQVYEVKETDFDDHDVTLWFVGGEALKCAAGCQIEVVSAPEETE